MDGHATGAARRHGPAEATSTGKARDVRLDFFRGIGMFIIFVAHVPQNAWSKWIPARFGWSDATEIFVFCSGMASAIAFGKVFAERGFAMGTARTAFRVWQVYWAHVALFFVTLTLLLVLDGIVGEAFYTSRLYVRPFLEDPAAGVVGLMTLTYVPNYFDILPMYLVILMMMPLVVTVGRTNRVAALALVGGSWLLANFGLLSLPADWFSDRPWFFNPFAWQLVFFTGFFFVMGWLPAPPIDRRLVLAAAAFVIVTVPFAWFRVANWFPVFMDVWVAIEPLRTKTELGLLRYVHFLCLAYLAYAAAGEGGRRLRAGGAVGVAIDVCRKVGQQALPVFLAGMVGAQFFGAVLDFTGRNALTWALANLAGFAVLIAVAYVAGWFKAAPWRRPPAPRSTAPAGEPSRAAQPAE